MISLNSCLPFSRHHMGILYFTIKGFLVKIVEIFVREFQFFCVLQLLGKNMLEGNFA